ncbi:MAG: glycerol acyltransferase, partial [Nocardioidaceae bacterium]|nr:glycerol acyltransferase [Nocardioidaceae bacterium]
MPDARVIPIGGDAESGPLGTRGTPGRGSGRAKPSSSSRGFAGGGAARTPPRKAAARKKPEPEPVLEEVPAPPVVGAVRDLPAPAQVSERHPRATPGIPLVDWLAGFTSASKEVFGDAWEPRLAEFLAFLRRRLTGDYVVDEFG